MSRTARKQGPGGPTPALPHHSTTLLLCCQVPIFAWPFPLITFAPRARLTPTFRTTAITHRTPKSALRSPEPPTGAAGRGGAGGRLTETRRSQPQPWGPIRPHRRGPQGCGWLHPRRDYSRRQPQPWGPVRPHRWGPRGGGWLNTERLPPHQIAPRDQPRGSTAAHWREMYAPKENKLRSTFKNRGLRWPRRI